MERSLRATELPHPHLLVPDLAWITSPLLPRVRPQLLFLGGEFKSRQTSSILFQHKDALDLGIWVCLK